MAYMLLIEETQPAKLQKSSHELRKMLERQGHKVGCVMADGDALLTPVKHCDIAIINVGSASGAGYALTRQLRAAQAGMGILLLAASQESAGARVGGLENGADFCEPMPERPELLNAYIDALLHRVVPATWRLDSTSRTLRAPRHDAVEINAREFALLRTLADSARHAADRSTIAQAFGVEWMNFDERVLEKTVSRLRRKWRDNTMCDLPLRTVHGVGYCFTEAIQVH
ncbi:MAG TPA: winged helix-turn-helix domain-containing protein [Herbaspirillum sp.]|uniref:response regulator transcription factor n=1 Tax=Herbaspirillum sp. TaxID=1890675 RepID=UPI002D758249|nr:winged helix-turn-helix domain-containing protein [Herbaspirillum sp.]HZG22008.1 winged helix-turn-helix domain-containing protein [Herbaspirillum sp.]